MGKNTLKGLGHRGSISTGDWTGPSQVPRPRLVCSWGQVWPPRVALETWAVLSALVVTGLRAQASVWNTKETPRPSALCGIDVVAAVLPWDPPASPGSADGAKQGGLCCLTPELLCDFAAVPPSPHRIRLTRQLGACGRLGSGGRTGCRAGGPSHIAAARGPEFTFPAMQGPHLSPWAPVGSHFDPCLCLSRGPPQTLPALRANPCLQRGTETSVAS